METKCPLCGAPMEEGRCGYCGHKEQKINYQMNQNVNVHFNFQENILQSVSKKDKTIALMLAIFLGGIGAHRFYVGKVGTGIIYMFTGGLFGIGWIADIVMILTGRFKDEFDLPLL